MAAPVAKKVNGVVMTSSPFPIPQDINASNTFSSSTTRFGWNAGLGFAFPLGSHSSSRFFIEGRYTSISVDADSFSNSVHRGGTRFVIIPVNAGFVF